MSRSDLDRCQDILAAIDKVMRYQLELSGADEEMAYDAIVRQLEIIGEASNRLDPAMRSSAPKIRWSAIIGLRNVAAHEYFRLDRSVIDGVIENYLFTLRAEVQRISTHLLRDK